MRNRAIKLTKSVDGEFRMTLKMEKRLLVGDMAIFLLMAARSDIDAYIKIDETIKEYHERVINNIKNWMSGKSNKEIKKTISDIIIDYGTETPHYSIYDDNLEFTLSFLEGYLERNVVKNDKLQNTNKLPKKP
jgi:predicted nucleotide-binding protein (sugar kinase/HSP70/actin superfamily)